MLLKTSWRRFCWRCRTYFSTLLTYGLQTTNTPHWTSHAGCKSLNLASKGLHTRGGTEVAWEVASRYISKLSTDYNDTFYCRCNRSVDKILQQFITWNWSIHSLKNWSTSCVHESTNCFSFQWLIDQLGASMPVNRKLSNFQANELIKCM